MNAYEPAFGSDLRANRWALLFAATTLGLAGCTMVGPTLSVSPGPGRTQASVAADHQACMAQTDAALRPISLAPGMTTAKIQQVYNMSYGQCMTARGNIVGADPSALSAANRETVNSATQSDPDSVSARQSLSRIIANFSKSCDGERIEPTVAIVTLAATVTARLITLSTPNGGMCFGQPGQNDYLLAKQGSSWRTLLAAEPGSIEVLASRHAGRADVAVHSLGMCVYTYRWNGTAYTQAASHGCSTAAPPTMRTLPNVIRHR